MDEFNISSLSEAKGEYSIRLVNVLTPYVLEGIQSIFDNAKSLCIKQDEYEKYLMTFQNLLSRVVNWNDALIQEEVERIIRKSQCSFIQELISSVHITQVKILTSVKLGNECKKISIEIPTINNFIHKVYIKTARKLYSNVYLFEESVLPLTHQKHRRECENIIQQSILDTIRDGIPVETILRSYLNDIEEDMEEKVETTNIVEEPDGSLKEVKPETETAQTTESISPPKVEDNAELDTNMKTLTMNGSGAPEVSLESNTETTTFSKPDDSNTIVDTEAGASLGPIISVNKEPELSSRPSSAPPVFTIKKQDSPKEQTLEFNNTDKVLDMGTNQVNNVTASKEVNVLEKISDERYEQRRLEELEDDEDAITINPSSNDDLSNLLNIETL